jgi:hypothetical protein
MNTSQSRGYTKVEFHCHTNRSHDCKIDLTKRLQQYSTRGFTHLAITDHDRTLPAKYVETNRKQFPSIQLIPGIEVSTFIGHIILLNCTKRPPLNSLAFLVLWARLFSAKLYVPHPFRKSTGILSEYPRRKIPTEYISWFLRHCEYIEAYNPRDSLQAGHKVDPRIVSRVLSMRWTIASDSHHEYDIREEGCPLEGFSAENSAVRALLESLDIAHVEFHFSTTAWWRYTKSALRYLRDTFI